MCYVIDNNKGCDCQGMHYKVDSYGSESPHD